MRRAESEESVPEIQQYSCIRCEVTSAEVRGLVSEVDCKRVMMRVSQVKSQGSDISITGVRNSSSNPLVLSF